MIWKTESVKNREELEKFLNKLENAGCVVEKIEIDQAQGNFIVIYKKPKAELFSD
jgi:hypothetical protein